METKRVALSPHSKLVLGSMRLVRCYIYGLVPQSKNIQSGQINTVYCPLGECLCVPSSMILIGQEDHGK